MTRTSTQGSATAGSCADELAAFSRQAGLLITIATNGARRTTLDLLAAQATSLIGKPDAVRAWLSAAMEELGPALLHGDGWVVAVGTSFELTELMPAPLAASATSATCAEALELLASAPSGVTTLVVVDSLAIVDDEPGVVALVEAARRRPRTAVLLEGPSAAATEQVDIGEAGSEPAGVDILGPVVGRGAARALARHPKLTELTVYLAVHEEGTPSWVWSEALWPGRAMPAQTIANRASELRGLLGFAPDGRPRLRKDGERYCLVDVRTDWSIVRNLAAPSGNLDRWRAALALVRGRPFTGLREASWSRVEGHETEIEQTITDCALRTSAALLDQGDPAPAAWAAEQGLKAVPWDERLHRALMKAGAAAGNLGKVEATLRHLALALDIDGDPLKGVHPETARLYGQLSGRNRPAATSQAR
jgi:hypothetical protein